MSALQEQITALIAMVMALLQALQGTDQITQTIPPPETPPIEPNGQVLLPPESGLYFGAFPDFGSFEDQVSVRAVGRFEELVGKDIAWGYFSDNWFDGITFPQEEVETLIEAGVTPYIRLMPRNNFDPKPRNWEYTPERIADGEFDDELRIWARSAQRVGEPLIIEFGTEVNGDWFPWNGMYNGGGTRTGYGDAALPDGPEKFVAAYRHIIELFRAEGVRNVTWVYHVNAISNPDTSWNQIESYYPGDAYIDWIGLSVYGAQRDDEPMPLFEPIFREGYQTIAAMTDKPIGLVEFGAAETDDDEKAVWIEEVFTTIESGEYPRLKAIAYWHSSWENSDGVSSRLRIDSSETALQAFRAAIQDPRYHAAVQYGAR